MAQGSSPGGDPSQIFLKKKRVGYTHLQQWSFLLGVLDMVAV
jgi:hypothetical protein